MTEQQAKMLAAELDQHRYWRVQKVCFNPAPYGRRVDVPGRWPRFEPRPPGWEVWLEHRMWPNCGSMHLFQDFPVQDAWAVPQALTEHGEQIDRWQTEWQRKHEQQG